MVCAYEYQYIQTRHPKLHEVPGGGRVSVRLQFPSFLFPLLPQLARLVVSLGVSTEEGKSRNDTC